MKDFILIPTYNERENISIIIPELMDLVPEANILVIDDSSPDGTADVVKELSLKYPNVHLLSRKKKKGLGAAYKDAFKKVLENNDVRYIITMDADGSHHPSYVPEIIKLMKNSNLVLGSRYIKGGGVESWELWRLLLSKYGNIYPRLASGLGVRDMTSGFTCLDSDTARKIDFEKIGASGYAYLMEFKFHIINDLGAKFSEYPIIFRSRREGESKMSSHIILEGLKTPFKLFLRRLTKLPLVGSVLNHSTSGFKDFGMPFRYLISGIVAATTNFGVLFILTEIFSLWYISSSILSFVASLFVSFLLQKFWTFRNHALDKVHHQAFFYILTVTLSLGVNTGVIFVLVEYLELWYMLSAVIAGVVISVMNFIFYKKIFR